MTDDSWWIYQGAGARHDGISRLPSPPPWRQFDGEVLELEQPAYQPLSDPRPGAEERARNYRPDPAVINMVNAALYLRRPLLVTGRPGTGKSSLALSIAWELQLGPVLSWAITSRSQLQQSLYRYDAVGRLQEANLRRLGQDGPPVTSASPYITLGPLGTALVARERPRVVLIDEFDKSDIDLPSRRRVMVSMWTKSVPNSPAAWVRRKVRQLVSASRGAGPILAAARIRRMVPAPTR